MITVEQLKNSGIPAITGMKLGVELKGFLSPQEADSIPSGGRLTTIANQEVVFFADDHMYGYKVLPRDFVPCTQGIPTQSMDRMSWLNTGTEIYNDFYKSRGLRLITSIQELVDYVNSRPT